jgi:hypothetical protein
MTIERAIRLLAGLMVLSWFSVALTQWVHLYSLWFTAFIGANLIQSSFTGFCPPEWLFTQAGFARRQSGLHPRLTDLAGTDKIRPISRETSRVALWWTLRPAFVRHVRHNCLPVTILPPWPSVARPRCPWRSHR